MVPCLVLKVRSLVAGPVRLRALAAVGWSLARCTAMDDGSRGASSAQGGRSYGLGGMGGLEGRPLVAVGTPLEGALVWELVPSW
jgi:hypothetical protein